MPRGVVELLFQVGLSVFIANDPRVQVTDRVLPWTQRNAAVGNVMILLYRLVVAHDCVAQTAAGRRQPTCRVAREVIPKQIGPGAGEAAENQAVK